MVRDRAVCLLRVYLHSQLLRVEVAATISLGVLSVKNDVFEGHVVEQFLVLRFPAPETQLLFSDHVDVRQLLAARRLLLISFTVVAGRGQVLPPDAR